MGYLGPLGSTLELLGCQLGASWSYAGHLGVSWRPLGAILAPSWGVLGAFWGSMLAHVGVCWPILRYLQDLKAFSRRNVRSWGQLGVNLEDFGANLEDFGAILETMLAYVGVCVAILKHLKVNFCTTYCFYKNLQKHGVLQCFLKVGGSMLRLNSIILGLCWDILEHLGGKWGYLGHLRASWSYVGHLGGILEHLGAQKPSNMNPPPLRSGAIPSLPSPRPSPI